MNGIQQGMMEAGREVGRFGGRMIEAGGHNDALTIVFVVLGIVLWAALMTALVMGIMALTRHLRGPKKESTDK